MSKQVLRLHRRRFLKTTFQAGAAVMAAQVIPGSALGKDTTAAPASGLWWAGSASEAVDRLNFRKFFRRLSSEVQVVFQALG